MHLMRHHFIIYSFVSIEGEQRCFCSAIDSSIGEALHHRE
jgi:hypothetical protein